MQFFLLLLFFFQINFFEKKRKKGQRSKGEVHKKIFWVRVVGGREWREGEGGMNCDLLERKNELIKVGKRERKREKGCGGGDGGYE